MSPHPTREEDFDLYALGALEGEEKKALESHVDSCTDCAAKLAEARGRIALLAFAAPPVAPPPGVKQRLMAQVRADSKVQAEAGSLAPGKISAARSRERAPGAFGWWAAVLLPVGVALAIATMILWNQNRQFDQQLLTLRSVVQIQQQELEDARQGAEMMGAGDTVVVPLAQQPGMPKGTGRVMYNARMGMLAYEGTLDPAPAQKSYQLWLVPAQGSPINAGVFNPAAGETSHWMMKLPQGIAPMAFAITMEPTGGMKQPTGPKVLVGVVS